MTVPLPPECVELAREAAEMPHLYLDALVARAMRRALEDAAADASELAVCWSGTERQAVTLRAYAQRLRERAARYAQPARGEAHGE